MHRSPGALDGIFGWTLMQLAHNVYMHASVCRPPGLCSRAARPVFRNPSVLPVYTPHASAPSVSVLHVTCTACACACSASRHFVLTINPRNSSDKSVVTVDYWDRRKNMFPLAFSFSHPQV